MYISVDIFMDNEHKYFSIGVSKLEEISIFGNVVKNLGEVYEITIAKSQIIITNNYGSHNNINSYDWYGNHLWNIGEIITNNTDTYDGCAVISKEQAIKSSPDIDVSNFQEGHDFLIAVSGAYHYIVDLNEKCFIYQSKGMKR